MSSVLNPMWPAVARMQANDDLIKRGVLYMDDNGIEQFNLERDCPVVEAAVYYLDQGTEFSLKDVPELKCFCGDSPTLKTSSVPVPRGVLRHNAYCLECSCGICTKSILESDAPLSIIHAKLYNTWLKMRYNAEKEFQND